MQTVLDVMVAGADLNSSAAQPVTGAHPRLEVIVGAAFSKVSPMMQKDMIAHSTSLDLVGAAVWYWFGKSQLLKVSQIRSEVSVGSMYSYSELDSEHTVSAKHPRSDVEVAAAVCHSLDSTHSVKVSHTLLEVAVGAVCSYSVPRTHMVV
jgi:hypothetical protein